MNTPSRWLRHVRLQTLLWVLVVLVVNHLASAVSVRVDATGDQRFTLSQAARDAVVQLDKPLLATVWFTSDLDPPYHEHAAALADTLDALAEASNGKLEVTWTDPTGVKDQVELAGRFGVRPVTYAYRAWDRQEARSVFMGISLVYGDRQEAVPALTSIPRMEYDVVRAVRRLTTPADKSRTVAILQGHGEPDLAQYAASHPVGVLRARLAERWALVAVNGEEAIPEDVAALLVLAPQSPIPPLALYNIDQFLMRGGGLGFFLSGVQPDYAAGTTREVRHGLAGLTGAWGVGMGRGVVLDRAHNERLALPAAGGGVVQVNSPLAPTTTVIDGSFAPVRELRRVALPFSVALSVADPLPPDVVAEVWVSTDNDAVARPGPVPLSAERLAEPAPNEVSGPFPAVVALTGAFPSFFAAGAPPGATGEHKSRSAPARWVVASSGDVAANVPDLVLNTTEWLLEDPSLAGIRSRTASAGLLTAPSANVAKLWKVAIVGLPMLFLAALAGVMSRRGRRT